MDIIRCTILGLVMAGCSLERSVGPQDVHPTDDGDVARAEASADAERQDVQRQDAPDIIETADAGTDVVVEVADDHVDPVDVVVTPDVPVVDVPVVDAVDPPDVEDAAPDVAPTDSGCVGPDWNICSLSTGLCTQAGTTDDSCGSCERVACINGSHCVGMAAGLPGFTFWSCCVTYSTDYLCGEMCIGSPPAAGIGTQCFSGATETDPSVCCAGLHY